MREDEILVGHAYERTDGTIRFVYEITDAQPGGYVGAISRLPGDAVGDWPGGVGSPLDVFAALSVREVPGAIAEDPSVALTLVMAARRAIEADPTLNFAEAAR